MNRVFNIGRLVVGLSLAKSGSFFTKTDKGDVQHHMLSLQIVEHESGLKAFTIIFLPFSFIIGISDGK